MGNEETNQHHNRGNSRTFVTFPEIIFNARFFFAHFLRSVNAPFGEGTDPTPEEPISKFFRFWLPQPYGAPFRQTRLKPRIPAPRPLWSNFWPFQGRFSSRLPRFRHPECPLFDVSEPLILPFWGWFVGKSGPLKPNFRHNLLLSSGFSDIPRIRGFLGGPVQDRFPIACRICPL